MRVDKKYIKIITHPTTQVVLALLLFIVATVASRGKSVPMWEANLFAQVNSWPAFLFPFFYLITQAGSIYMLLGLLVLYAYKRSYHVVLRLLMTGTLAYLLAGFAKSIWGRDRPFDLLENVLVLDTFQGPGFPSGHTALAVALALTVGHYITRHNFWLPAVWIIGVALSRMYLGVHIPLDIVGGFAVGWLSYALFRHVRITDIAPGKPKKKKSTLTRR